MSLGNVGESPSTEVQRLSIRTVLARGTPCYTSLAKVGNILTRANYCVKKAEAELRRPKAEIRRPRLKQTRDKPAQRSELEANTE
jgi:hypothetical protein